MSRVMRLLGTAQYASAALSIAPYNSIQLVNQGQRQRAPVDIPLEIFRRDGDGGGRALRGSLGVGAGERVGGGDGDGGGEDEGELAHESLLGASWREASPQTPAPV